MSSSTRPAIALLVFLALAPGAPAQSGITREVVYSKLSQSQQAAEAKDWDQAFELLDDVSKIRNLSGHEKAQLYTAYGYTYFLREDIARSMQEYERVLEIEDAPEGMIPTTLYILAQLSFHVERYEAAVGYLERWLQQATNPGPEPFVLMGQAYFQLERLRDAVEPIERAIQIAKERGQEPEENWYSLLRALYYELDDKPNLLKTLEILVTKFPKAEYWTHLGAVHGEMGNEDKQLAAYEIAYRQGYLSSDAELRLYAQLLIQAEVPYGAGVLLQQSLESGAVESTPENWRLLSQAWMLAHEHQRAIEALTQAASLAPDGELDARLAQSYARLDEWEKVVGASQDAVRKGVEDAHDMLLLMGEALIELDRLEEAKVVFQTAQETPEARERASRWLAYIDSEQARRRELEASLR